MTQIILPRHLHIGGGSLSALPGILQSLHCTHPCIITDPTMVELGYVARIKDLLAEQNMAYGLFDQTMPEPDDHSIHSAVQQVTEHGYDCLIALGGGSAIDSAKAISLLASHGGQMRDYKVPYVVHQQSVPVIAIPTTAGTGSEATRVTVIADKQSDEKMLCMGPGLIPSAAIVDYELTLSLPFRIAADTGIDALTHAIEAYVSRKAHPFSDHQAIAAMKLIAPNLIKVCHTPTDTQAKADMMLGATLAGIAFSNASVGLVHGMSRPLGVHFHVPHGLSNAMLLPAITRYSLTGAPERYAECAVHMGLISQIDNIDDAHQVLLDAMTNINQSLDVPTLSQFGIEKSAYFDLIETMTEQALASGSPANNPLIPDPTTLHRLYKEVWQ